MGGQRVTPARTVHGSKNCRATAHERTAEAEDEGIWLVDDRSLFQITLTPALSRSTGRGGRTRWGETVEQVTVDSRGKRKRSKKPGARSQEPGVRSQKRREDRVAKLAHSTVYSQLLSSLAQRPRWREIVEEVTVDRRVGQIREPEMGSLTLLTAVHRSPLSHRPPVRLLSAVYCSPLSRSAPRGDVKICQVL